MHLLCACAYCLVEDLLSAPDLWLAALLKGSWQMHCLGKLHASKLAAVVLASCSLLGQSSAYNKRAITVGED